MTREKVSGGPGLEELALSKRYNEALAPLRKRKEEELRGQEQEGD